MRRRLFTFFSAVSLLLCVAVCVLWVRSYVVGDGFHWLRPDVAGARWASETVWSEHGRLSAYVTRVTYAGPEDVIPEAELRQLVFGGPGLFHATFDLDRFEPVQRSFALDLGGGSVRDASELHKWEARAPHWSLALATALAPAAWCRTRLTGRRRGRAGLCPACGYDLRATPDRCPECGAAATPVSGDSVSAGRAVRSSP